MRYFALGFALFVLAAGAAVSGRVTAAPATHDSPQMRDAIALVTANIGASVTNFSLEWDDPPHVLSATTIHGDTVVLEEIRMSVNSYDASAAPTHMRFVVRGVVSPLNWLRSLKVISHRELKVAKAGKG